MLKNITKLLTILKVQKSISQRELCKKIDVSQSQLSKWETGDKDFPLNKFVAYSAALGIKPTALLDCVMMDDADEAVKKALNEIDDAPGRNSLACCEENLKTIVDYWKKEYFTLYNEYLKLCRQKDVTPLLTK